MSGPRPDATSQPARTSPRLLAFDAGTAAGSHPVVRVVVAEHHPQIRSGLRALLETDPATDVLAESGDLALTRQHVAGHRPDVLVLDLELRDGSSLHAIGEIRRDSPSTRIVALGADDTLGFARSALGAGASGFVLKDRADEELIDAVAAADAGEEYVSGPIRAGLARLHQRLTAGRLSGREAEVLRLIALGHTSSAIAGQLSLSPRTIETHRSSIHAKLGLRTRAELVAYALSCGLLGV